MMHEVILSISFIGGNGSFRKDESELISPTTCLAIGEKDPVHLSQLFTD